MIFGGGYDTAEDTVPPGSRTTGRAVYVVNGNDGTIVGSWGPSQSGTYRTGGSITTYSVPSQVTAINADFDSQDFLDRIVVGECREADEVMGFLRAVNTGHPGSITTVHATSAKDGLQAMLTLGGSSTKSKTSVDHIASLIASIVLLTRHPVARAVLYFWAFALCTQAMITPSLVEPPNSGVFWSFWFLHGFVMMTAIYDIAVNGFRPGWRDYGIACAASASYVALTLPVNLLLGSNYGFTGQSRPLNPSIVDLLGPWPARLLLIVPLAALAMLVVLLPWLVARRVTTKSTARRVPV